jgi:hypothetical protein
LFIVEVPLLALATDAIINIITINVIVIPPIVIRHRPPRRPRTHPQI